jgi:hypothetical protein
MSEGKKTDWKEWLGIAAFWYVPAGIMFLLMHKDPEISPLGWFGIYLASPVILGGGLVAVCALALAICIPVIWTWRRFNLSVHFKRYDLFLNDIEDKFRKAEREGRKWEAIKLKTLFWIVAIPMVILIYLIAAGGAARYD